MHLETSCPEYQPHPDKDWASSSHIEDYVRALDGSKSAASLVGIMVGWLFYLECSDLPIEDLFERHPAQLIPLS